ncbi:MAG: hypothetical protein QOJ08_1134 [Ilumatobacteraceae bacterium]|jgi:uncharacterized membrane protein
MRSGEYPLRCHTKPDGTARRYAAAVSTRGVEAMGVRLDQRNRLLIALLLGAIAATIAASSSPWQMSVLIGWDVVAVFVAGSVWTFIHVLDAESTRKIATREDDSHAGADFVMVLACLISLVGVVVGLAHARAHPGAVSSVLTGISVFTVFLSWFTVHTLFVLRYARLFYVEPIGGIDFGHSKDLPDYMDFVYVAFTVGMTFQVSDTGIGDRVIRRTIIRHALLSYVFGTVIVGIAINVVGNLIR